MNRRRCFSIIELLVVIGIIAILVGIFLSASGSSMDGQLKAETQGTINQVQLAIDQYMAEEGSYPSTSAFGVSRLLQWTNTGSAKNIIADLRSYEPFLISDHEGKNAILDAWDNPILYIPSDEYENAYEDNEVVEVKISDSVLANIIYYNHRTFQLISAGEDGDFLTKEDNLYNFDLPRDE